MPTAAAGSVSLSKSYLREQLANCSTFQTLCGVSTKANALPFIFYDSLPEKTDGTEYSLAELQAVRPHAIISLIDRVSTPQGVSGNGAFSMSRTFTHEIRLERNVPSAIAGDAGEVNLTWDNIWGSIMDELEALSGQAGYLACSLQKSDGPYRTHPEDHPNIGDAQQVTLVATTQE